MKSYLIQSRAIREHDSDGRRLRQVGWGGYETWTKFRSPIANFRDAVNEVTKRMEETHVGFVVYRTVIMDGEPTDDIQPLYQAKWGHDDMAFTAYKPLGEKWRRGVAC